MQFHLKCSYELQSLWLPPTLPLKESKVTRKYSERVIRPFHHLFYRTADRPSLTPLWCDQCESWATYGSVHYYKNHIIIPHIIQDKTNYWHKPITFLTLIRYQIIPDVTHTVTVEPVLRDHPHGTSPVTDRWLFLPPKDFSWDGTCLTALPRKEKKENTLQMHET